SISCKQIRDNKIRHF
ncbi:unnamed protein product, partial [Callosobruchus maculatus]